MTHNKYQYTCDDCNFSWRSDENVDDAKKFSAEKNTDGDYESGAECPNCESENIGGEQLK